MTDLANFATMMLAGDAFCGRRSAAVSEARSAVRCRRTANRTARAGVEIDEVTPAWLPDPYAGRAVDVVAWDHLAQRNSETCP